MARSGAGQAGVIWDIPLRIFHWALAIATAGLFASAEFGVMFAHEKLGLTVLGLIGFRLIWGFVGSHHARFVNFMVGPKAAINYIKSRIAGDRSVHPGHAPTGAYATLAILVIFGVMASLGTMANDDILYEGPLAAYVGDFTNTARKYHHMMEDVVFGIVMIHLAAIAVYYFLLKINLIPAMIKGGTDENVPPLSKAHQIYGIILLVVMVLAAQSIGLLGDRFY